MVRGMKESDRMACNEGVANIKWGRMSPSDFFTFLEGVRSEPNYTERSVRGC